MTTELLDLLAGRTLGNILTNMTIKIYGYGWVGKAMKQLFPQASVHDPALGAIAIEKADVAFVCVPTPCRDEGELDMSIVDEVVSEAKEDFLIVRSTVNPGTSEYLAKTYNKKIVFQPEYLGESVAHPLLDPKKRPFLIIGGKSKDRRKAIDLYTTVYNANTNIRQVSNYEAEIIKLSENRAIFFKVSQCQELYDVCEKAGVDFYTIRDAVYGDDPRFNLWWTFVFPGNRGSNSKCIPKDVYAWCSWAESLGYKPDITRAMLKRNKKWI